ncbi:MAG: Asp-tRNA(Asn)/Glu-tRNA(Gln) amidotransferase subunit GatB [Patescibacteria group bacterium]
MKYLPTIGLEIHAELATKTKMFCRCLNDPEEKQPNVNICPICLAHPGTLPAINQAAVKSVLRVGLALGAKLENFTEWDRKNYFYPDIPKGYQISQYKYPLVTGGSLDGVAITRVHLEEDTAKSLHDQHDDHSVVDFNRAGVPLMELVTEPVIGSAKQAADFAKELQLLLRYLGVSEASMEKGQMRVEANISIRLARSDSQSDLGPDGKPVLGLNAESVGRTGKPVLGTKVEVKNLNSFRSVERAILYELKRQEEILEKGDQLVQETRGWDEEKQITFSQREKESSHDYRYFPDPDLPKLYLSEIEDFKNLTETLPELPWQKRDRYRADYGLKDEDTKSYIIDAELGKFFDDMTKLLEGNKDLIKLASNYLTSDFLGIRKTNLEAKLPSEQDFAELIKMAAAGDVSSRGTKDILAILVTTGGHPRQIAKEKGLIQKHDESEILALVEKVIATNPKVFEDYKAGHDKALQFLIGQGMKESQGSANPEILAKLFANKKI